MSLSLLPVVNRVERLGLTRFFAALNDYYIAGRLPWKMDHPI